MFFRELKQGYPVYGLYKDEDNLRLVTGKVVNIGDLYFDTNFQSSPGQRNPLSMPASTMNRVVDVTIEFEGKTSTYTISENSSFVYAGNLVMATDKDPIIKELEVLKSQSEEALSKVDFHKARVTKCKEILSSWNPVFKEKEETEKRFNKIEGDVDEIKSDLKLLLQKLS